MKEKLAKFTEFANRLYPHEIDYLLNCQQFQSDENLKILHLISYNSKNPFNTIFYDPTIDKRKYTYLKNWICRQLESIDVDLFYDWLIALEKKVMTDNLLPDEENELLKKTRTITPSHYYFIRFYELLQHYRDYLLIRVRNRYYEPISTYLQDNLEKYRKASETNTQLNSATVDIIRQHESSEQEADQWEEFLKNTFYNTELDGYTRYRAVVRLTFLYYNYREFEKLRSVYFELDRLFKTEVFYSKRLMANYYANRAMMHSKLNELELAERFGYLSIRQQNSDYLFYLLNLCPVLLKQKKNKAALKIMTASLPEMKKTASFYSKIGFVAYYLRTLLANEKISQAVDFGESYFSSYRKEIFEHRWHLFFSAYLQALLRAEHYPKLISLAKRFDLIKKEKQFIGNSKYLPVITWHYLVAQYVEAQLTEKELKEQIVSSATKLLMNHYKKRKIQELLDELSFVNPQLFKKIRTELFREA